MINVDFLAFFCLEMFLYTNFFHFQIALIVGMVLNIYKVVIRRVELILRAF